MKKCKKEKPTLIIFEGVDGAGKTTLAEHLAKYLEIKNVEHFEAPKDFYKAKKEYNNFLEMCNSNTILDRFHHGEAVYGVLYRKNDIDEVLDFYEKFEFDLMEKFDVKLIYVDADKDTILTRFKERGEDFIKWEDIETIQHYYKEHVLKTTYLPYIEINTSKKSIEKNVKDIINFIAKGVK